MPEEEAHRSVASERTLDSSCCRSCQSQPLQHKSKALPQLDMRDSASPARSHGCTQRSSTLSIAPSSVNSASMPSLSSLALSLSTITRPFTHHKPSPSSLQPPSPMHAVSLPIDRIPTSVPMFRERHTHPGPESPTESPPHQPQTFPPFLDTPLSHYAWPQRNMASRDTPRSTTPRSGSAGSPNSTSRPTVDSPTAESLSPPSDASPFTHKLLNSTQPRHLPASYSKSAAAVSNSQLPGSMLPPPARHSNIDNLQSTTRTAATGQNPEHSTGISDSLLFAPTHQSRPPTGRGVTSRHYSISGELPTAPASNGVAARSRGMRTRVQERHTYPRIALGVSQRVPDTGGYAAHRLSFDFRDDERPVAPDLSMLFQTAHPSKNRSGATSNHAVRSGATHRSFQTMQGADTDADTATQLADVSHAGHALRPAQRAKHSTHPEPETGGSNTIAMSSQELVWEQGEVWQCMPSAGSSPVPANTLASVECFARTTAAEYGRSPAHSLKQSSVPEATVSSRCASVPPQHGPSQHMSASAAAEAVLPRSMLMKQRSIVLAEEEDACMPWQLGMQSASSGAVVAQVDLQQPGAKCTTSSDAPKSPGAYY